MNANISYDDHSAVAAKHRNKNQGDQNENTKTIQTKTTTIEKRSKQNTRSKIFQKNRIGKTRNPNKRKPIQEEGKKEKEKFIRIGNNP